MEDAARCAQYSLRNKSLLAFLQGTRDRQSPLHRLRGQQDVLRLIWTAACEQWWALHIDLYPRDPPLLLEHPRWPSSDGPDYPMERKESGGCPIAIVAEGLVFPPLAVVPMGTFENQENEYLYVNMMPFDLTDLKSLPPCCRQYAPIIEKVAHMKAKDERIAYLTIDERPVSSGKPQRRGGLHVESPGFLPVVSGSEPLEARFIPGAEHHWGGGMMMRNQKICGGIFMASNVSASTAIWNCKIVDRDGSIIGAHGNIERMRSLLGPADIKLNAGELVWITDKTPHESLPLHQGTVRQYIRVVTGDVTAWFADHSTPNPCGILPPDNVRIVTGNKFDLYGGVGSVWESGSCEELGAVKEQNELRRILYQFGLGHLANGFVNGGICSVSKLISVLNTDKWYEKINQLFDKCDGYGKFFFELRVLEQEDFVCLASLRS